MGPVGPLVAYLSEVIQFNHALGLVSRKDPVAACERLLLESLELARVLEIQGEERVADVGSGAGFPGLVWALTFPRLRVTMIERQEKRALFLERMCRSLQVSNAAAMGLDARDVSSRTEVQHTFDLVATIAVGDPSILGPIVEPLLVAGGRFVSTIASRTSPPDQVGARLHIERRLEGKFGCYAIYRCGV